MFSINPHLGPLQISLGRMIIDIIKFFFIYMLVLFAFGCGMNQLLWYYADMERKVCYSLPGGLPDFDNNREPCIFWRRFAKYSHCTKNYLNQIIGGFFFSSEQLVWNIAITFLGQFWSCRSRIVRIDWHQRFHSLLGTSYVRLLLNDQYYRAIEHAYCHDVQLVPSHSGNSKQLNDHH